MTSAKKTIEELIVDPKSITPDSGSLYPPPHDKIVEGRHRHRLSPAIGLTNYGVNMVRVDPARHPRRVTGIPNRTNLFYVVSGTATLVSDEGETELGQGMAAGFPAGNPNGHQIVNRSQEDVWYLEVGDRPQNEDVTYPDVDMANAVRDRIPHFTRKDGSSFDD